MSSGARSAALRKLSLGVFFLSLVLENPKERPALNRWRSPIRPLGDLLFENLNTLTGITPLRFALIDVLLIGLVFVCLVHRSRAAHVSPPPFKLDLWLRVAFGAVVWLELYGMMRGGDFKASLWQIRQVLFLPALAFVFSVALETPRDLPTLARIVVFAALVKAALVIWFHEVICRPMGFNPPYASTHSDTLIFVATIFILWTRWVEVRSTRARLQAVLVTPVVLGAIIMNNRRLAFVDLAAASLLVWLLLPRSRFTDRLRWAAVAAAPLAAAYLVVGAYAKSPVFGPARSFVSLFSGADRSAGTRDIENYNLILTWKQNLLFGSGFGHEYLEISKADSIAAVFPLYRYVGHNSVLWLFSVGGLVGFALVWMPLLLGVFYALRAYPRLRSPTERAAALTALCVLGSFVLQAYGDMGLQSWPGVFLAAVAIAIAGKLAVTSGAVPAAVRRRARGKLAPLARAA